MSNDIKSEFQQILDCFGARLSAQACKAFRQRIVDEGPAVILGAISLALLGLRLGRKGVIVIARTPSKIGGDPR